MCALGGEGVVVSGRWGGRGGGFLDEESFHDLLKWWRHSRGDHKAGAVACTLEKPGFFPPTSTSSQTEHVAFIHGSTSSGLRQRGRGLGVEE